MKILQYYGNSEAANKKLATRQHSFFKKSLLFVQIFTKTSCNIDCECRTFLSKQDEGSKYRDNTTGADTADNAIAPGRIYNYVWEVPERAGPGSKDTECLTWGYSSDVNPIRDTNSGLVGPLIICKKVRYSFDSVYTKATMNPSQDGFLSE